VWQPIARTQFEAIIAAETRRIETCQVSVGCLASAT
jgi:hypothetical protein